MHPHVFLCVLALLVALPSLSSAAQPLLTVGVARIDVTPDYPVRLTGYGNRRTNAEGAAQRLWAKALVFGADAEGPRVLFTVDNLGVPMSMTDEVATRLAKRGVAREHVAINASHTHSAPMLAGVAPNIFSADLIPEQRAATERYTRELTDKLEQAALAALSNRAAAKLSWTTGTVTFAKNRRVMRENRAQFGENAAGPVDHTLPVLIVRDNADRVRAVLANYACHCTTMGGEFNQLHGDWAGCAQEAIERAHPGAVALISIGCGADANPSPRGSIALAQGHGEALAKEVSRLLAGPTTPLAQLPRGKLKRFDLDFDPLPTRAQWEERAKRGGIVGYHARKNLARLDRSETLPTTLPYSVQTWTFGDDLAMVFLPGEVVIDFQLRLKRELDGTRLWLNAYANDSPCYIPSRRILREGGYEAEDSLWYYDRPARLAPSTEDRIINAVHELLPKSFAPPEKRAGTPPPLSPEQALRSFRVAPELAVELVAAEPLVVDPVAIDWGADGKLWVAEMHDYPAGLDGNWQPGGRVKFLQDTNGDGRMDVAALFLDRLPFPTGVFAWGRGVLVCAAPDILYAEDTDGDGRADLVRKLFTGFATDNYQARVNSLSLGLDGWVYGANGLLGGKIRFLGADGAASSLPAGDSRNRPLAGELDIRGRDFRLLPDTGAFEPVSGLTQQGRVRDDFGNWFGCDNSHLIWHYPFPDDAARRNPHVAAPRASVHVPARADWNRLFPASETLERFNDAAHANRVTSACGLEIYRDRWLGDEFYGNAFTCEPVHNLVHREVLVPDGNTFRSERAPHEAQREFLASTDNWFRPAQVRTGPDGALWVVDMYRFVIEHPRWIPSNRLAQLDVRAGADKGRIYRVVRRDAQPHAPAKLATLPAHAVAAAIASPNGTVRDMAQRELLNRGGAKQAFATLTELARNDTNAAVRVQALWTLQSLGGTVGELVRERWPVETDPLVRAQFVKLAAAPELKDVIVAAAGDRDPRVRFEAALALHAVPGNARALRALGREASTNQWLRAGLLSSATKSALELIPAAAEIADTDGRAELVPGLLATALGGGADVTTLVEKLAPQGAPTKPWRFDALAQVASSARSAVLPETLVTQATALLTNDSAALALRSAALRFAVAVPTAGMALDSFRHALSANALRAAALETFSQARDARFTELLFERWNQFTPADRARVLDRLASRSDGPALLLGALRGERIRSGEISPALRNRLLEHRDATVREQAAALFPKRESSRAAVVARYRQELAGTQGNATRGAQVFAENCASCHRLDDTGAVVGPDLAAWRSKSAEDWLVAILDPNAAVEPRYLNYLVATKAGAALVGVIRSESATSVELAGPGLHQAVLRTDVDRIEALPASLMPEGLEENIPPAAMADLLAFLTARESAR